ncbi:glycosyltransferase [Bowmanella denitrificans]|uniref:Glycosyltransferase n=1 Tax=Bowmanella denitrificans TaxID=366582 RepID=A0ABN0XPQ3_9ALTE
MTEKKRHIAHVIYRFDTGGLENGLVNLINSLPEHEYQHSIVTHKGANPDFAKRVTVKNVRYYDLNKGEGNDIGVLWRLNRLLKRLNPDVLHTRNLATLEGQLVGWWRKIPLRIHGEHGWGVNDLGGVNIKYQRLRRLFRPFVHQYVALSAEAKEYLLDKIGVTASKVAHICNGVDTERFASTQRLHTPLPEIFLPQDCVVFGTVGRLAEVKNQAYLIDAFAELLKMLPSHRDRIALMLVGDGVTRIRLQKRVVETGIEDRVWFAGDRADVPALMQSMDVFVLPSLAEGISNTVLEAMATGLPVLATNVGGNPDLIMPEYVRDHLVPVGEPQRLAEMMARYALQPQLAESDGYQIQAYCQSRFSLASMVAKYHAIYRQVDKD